MAAQQLASLRAAVSDAISEKEATYEALGRARENAAELQAALTEANGQIRLQTAELAALHSKAHAGLLDAPEARGEGAAAAVGNGEGGWGEEWDADKQAELPTSDPQARTQVATRTADLTTSDGAASGHVSAAEGGGHDAKPDARPCHKCETLQRELECNAETHAKECEAIQKDLERCRAELISAQAQLAQQQAHHASAMAATQQEHAAALEREQALRTETTAAGSAHAESQTGATQGSPGGAAAENDCSNHLQDRIADLAHQLQASDASRAEAQAARAELRAHCDALEARAEAAEAAHEQLRGREAELLAQARFAGSCTSFSIVLFAALHTCPHSSHALASSRAWRLWLP